MRTRRPGWTNTKRHGERLLLQDKPGSGGEEETEVFLKLEIKTQWVKAPHGQSIASRPVNESWAEKDNPNAKHRQWVREL